MHTHINTSLLVSLIGPPPSLPPSLPPSRHPSIHPSLTLSPLPCSSPRPSQQVFHNQYSSQSGGQHYALFMRAPHWAKSLADDYDDTIQVR